MDLINVSLMKKNILWTMWELAIPHRNVLSVTNKLLLHDFRLDTLYLQMTISGYLESLKNVSMGDIYMFHIVLKLLSNTWKMLI